MADEILNKLGFDVSQALSALSQLDTRLKTSQTVFQAHASQLSTWNAQARAVIDTMKTMRQVAAGIQLPSLPIPTTPTAQAVPAKGLWLPSGLQTQIDRANQGMSQLADTSATAGQQITQAGNQGGAAINDANKSTERFIMSWRMIGRIVMTQMIVRVMSQIRNALREATAAAIDFQRSIAEIEAIAPPTAMFRTLGNEIAAASARFNIPLPDVAEGLYQTISNQFVEVSDRANIMEAAMKLARVGVMDLGDAVSVLTAALNAYGLSSTEAESVAAKFFRTIQLGRVRGKELADVMGQVYPIASQLGVSLDEVNASMVSMTIGGMDAHKSATALRQAMLAFIKPSDNMIKIFRGLGYTSAEQMIAAEKWGGSLTAITDAAGGMITEVGKAVRRVRALTGVLSMTREESEKYNQAVEAMKTTTAESMEEIYQQFTRMPAEKLTKQINELKVVMTRDFGNMIAALLADMVSFIGGVDNMVAALKGALAAAISLGLGIAVLAIKVALAAGAFTAFWVALGPVGWAVLGVSAAIAAFTFASSKSFAGFRDDINKAHQALQEMRQDLEAEKRKRMDALRDELEERDQAFQKGMARVRKFHFAAMDTLKESNRELVASTRETLGSMVKVQERIVSTYRKAAQAAANAVCQSRQRQITAEASYSDAIFKYAHQNEGAHRKTETYMRRAAFLAKDAAEAMKKAKTPEQISAAQAIFQRANAAAQEAENIAKTTKNTMLQGDAQRMVLHIMRKKTDAEQTLQKIQAQGTERLARRAAEEQKNRNEMKTLMKTILTDFQAFDKQGPKDPLQLKAQHDRLSTSIKRMRELWLQGDKIDLSQMMAFDQLQQRVQTILEGGVSEAEVQKLWATPTTLENFRKAIEDGTGVVNILFDARLPERLLEEMEDLTATEKMDVISRESTRLGKVITDFTSLEESFRGVSKTVVASKETAQEGLDKWIQQSGLNIEGIRRMMERPGAYRGKEAVWAEALDEFIAASQRFVDMPIGVVDAEDFARVKTSADDYMEALGKFWGSATDVEAVALAVSMMQEYASEAKKRRDLIGGLEVKAPQAQEAKALLPLLDELLRKAHEGLPAAASAMRKVKEETATARGELTTVSQVNMSNLISQVGQLAQNMWSAAQASQQINIPASGEFVARGGRMGRYLAAGGPAGTDVIPAWLTRGEFVMSAAATRQFASQIVAMNAGVQPNFRSDGGSVTNVGDINVSVKGGDSGRQTARTIAAELRRELRRGTTTL